VSSWDVDFGHGGENALPESGAERDATIDEFVAATNATIRHGGDRAFFTTGGDYIQMPEFRDFKSVATYYGTLFHEMGHWTGAKARLNREFGKRFGDKAYAAEELVAELTSARRRVRYRWRAAPRRLHRQLDRTVEGRSESLLHCRQRGAGRRRLSPRPRPRRAHQGRRISGLPFCDSELMEPPPLDEFT
jgi:hypothetical protein